MHQKQNNHNQHKLANSIQPNEKHMKNKKPQALFLIQHHHVITLGINVLYRVH